MSAAVQRLYVAYFNRPADPVGLAHWVAQLPASPTQAQLTTIAGSGFSASAEYAALYAGQTNTQIVNNLYLNLFGRAAEPAGLIHWAGRLTAGTETFASIALQLTYSAQGTDLTAINNKVTASTAFTTAVDLSPEIIGYNGTAAAASARTWLAAVTDVASTLTTATAGVDAAVAAAVLAGNTTGGSTFVLTTSADTVSGTSGNDTITGTNTTFTVGDSINGGAGTDTFNYISAGAIAAAAPVGATVTNVETVNFTSDAAITADVTSFTGITTATTTNAGANNVILTGAATTDLTVTNTTLAAGTVTVNGGKAITVTTGELTASGGTGGALSVGAATASAGAVTVSQALTSGNVTGGSTATGGVIGVTGGTVINVTQTIAPTSAAAATVLTGNVTVNNTGGAITVTGTSATTAVTVTQSAAVTAVASTTIGRIGIIDGAVDVLDANRASATAAGTISTVTITNAGAATVNSGALTTLNLGGTLTTVDASVLGALTTPANTTLALGLTGAVSTGAVTIDTDITTLNVSGNTTASTINSLVASGATTINVSGNALVTLTGNTTAAVTAVNVTNTGGASFGTALGTGVTFTGGAGADSIILTANFTKAMTMGAGNDTVTYAAQGTGGSVAAGDGTDTIIMTTAEADAVDANSTFNTRFTGFETLRLSDAHTTSIDLDGINAVTRVILAAGSTGGTIGNLASGGTVQTNADNAGATAINVKSALVGPTDVLNYTLSKNGILAAGTVTVVNVETINISVADAVAAGSNAAIHTMALAATSATSVVVTGNNGLTLTNTGNVAITNFDASGVVANSTAASTFVAATTDSAANLAVTFASANVTAAANVTIRGGAGNDTLTGSVAKDTISGGAGADRIYSDNAGNKEVQTVTITYVANETNVLTVGGIGVTFVTGANQNAATAALTAAINARAELSGIVAAVDTGGGVVTMTWLVDGDQIASVDTTSPSNTNTVATTTAGTAGTVAVDSIDGGAGADVLVGGGGGDTITTGAGADTVFMLQAHSVLATLTTITDYTFAVGGASNDRIILGDQAAAIGTTTTVQDLSASASLAAAMGAAANTNIVNNGLSVFIFGGDTYAFVETTGATTTYVATDFVVKLTGVPLAAGTAIAGTGFDAV